VQCNVRVDYLKLAERAFKVIIYKKSEVENRKGKKKRDGN